MLNQKELGLIKLLSFLTPIFGVMVFTIVIKFTDSQIAITNLPYFQAASAISAFINFGIYYNNNINNRLLIVYSILYAAVILVSILCFYYRDKWQYLFFISIFFIFGYYSLKLYIESNFIGYLKYNFLLSIFYPVMLLVDEPLVCYFLVFFDIFLIISTIIIFYKYSISSGFNNFSTVLISQSFLLGYQIFDDKINALLGAINYAEYILFYKYLYGVVTVFFSYWQNLLVARVYNFPVRILNVTLLGTFILFIISFWLVGYIKIILLIFIFSIFINLFALKLRIIILKSGSLYSAILAFFAFFSYYIIITTIFINEIHTYVVTMIVLFAVYYLLLSFKIRKGRFKWAIGF